MNGEHYLEFDEGVAAQFLAVGMSLRKHLRERWGDIRPEAVAAAAMSIACQRLEEVADPRAADSVLAVNRLRREEPDEQTP